MKLAITNEDKKHLKKILNSFAKPKTDKDIFYSLCFCICAPQMTFKKNIEVIKKLQELNFYSKPYGLYCDIRKLYDIMKPTRFYKNKTVYLLEAKEKFPKILDIIKNIDTFYCYKVKFPKCKKLNSYEKRDWLIKNVKGLGMKTASHFLRNLGDIELAIIDTHIIKFLEGVTTVKGLNGERIVGDWQKFIRNKKGYLKAEEIFQKRARYFNLAVAELDALIWKVLSGTSWEDFKF